MIKQFLYTAILFLIISGNLKGQDTIPADIQEDKMAKLIETVFKYAPIPYVGYSTETDIIFGIAKYNAFKIHSKQLPDAQIQPSHFMLFGYYTLEKQYKIESIIDLMYGANKFNSTLDMMIVDYPSYYFGIGNNTREEDKFLMDYKSIRFMPTFDYNVYKKMYIGASILFENYFNVSPVNPDSLHTPEMYEENEGIQSGIGLRFFREARDNRIRAKHGSYIYTTYNFYTHLLGSKFDYTALTIDLRKYITPIPQLTIASQFFTEMKVGNVPIQSMALLGGTERMRGIYENRYRDKTQIFAQTELRFPIIWIISGAAFAGLGQVAPTYGNLRMDSFKYGYGGGLRLLIDKASDSVLRLDVSFRKDGHSVFIGFNEAF